MSNVKLVRKMSSLPYVNNSYPPTFIIIYLSSVLNVYVQNKDSISIINSFSIVFYFTILLLQDTKQMPINGNVVSDKLEKRVAKNLFYDSRLTIELG